MTVPLPGGGIVLGRGPDNDVDVDDDTVSRRHAVIIQTPDGFVLRDLGSANGTYLNRDEVGHQDKLLSHGDKIRLAGSEPTFIFRQKSTGTVKMGAGSSEAPAPREESQAGPSEEGEAALNDMEAALLELLESRRGAAVSRQEIAAQVWPEVPPDELTRKQTIDKSVLRLRAYLHDDPRRPKHLITAGDYGYVMV
jgi:hypothetical protein